jgi:hypothetical protein
MEVLGRPGVGPADAPRHRGRAAAPGPRVTAGDGTIRDSAYYSIVAAGWPAVREELLHRLEDTVTKRG